MPKIGAQLLRELDPVAGIVRVTIGESRITGEILSFQFFVVFKSAGSQHDSFARAQIIGSTLFFVQYANDLIARPKNLARPCTAVDRNRSPRKIVGEKIP